MSLAKPSDISSSESERSCSDYSRAKPLALRLDASSACQLKCPLCPVTSGATHKLIGWGMLDLENFRKLLDHNPQIRRIELANAGESFLNKSLPQILQLAHERGVRTSFDQGVNLNTASLEALEAVVKYQTEVVRVPIDGITQKTYEFYRKRGSLRRVLSHIETINKFKEQYGSEKPHLRMQFVVFGHNEHEMDAAIFLSKMLKMEIVFRLNWSTTVYPVQDREKVRKMLGYADRDEFFEKQGKHYCHNQCLDLWRSPTVNWDGKLLGCCRNLWTAFADNVFEGPLEDTVNTETIRYARQQIMGTKPARDDIPCTRCSVYEKMTRSGKFITPDLIDNAQERIRQENPPR